MLPPSGLYVRVYVCRLHSSKVPHPLTLSACILKCTQVSQSVVNYVCTLLWLTIVHWPHQIPPIDVCRPQSSFGFQVWSLSAAIANGIVFLGTGACLPAIGQQVYTRMTIVCSLQNLMPQQMMLPRSLSSVVSCVACLRIASFSLSAGFPALFFVPAGLDVQPVLYSQQERELEDLVAFVETHSYIAL